MTLTAGPAKGLIRGRTVDKLLMTMRQAPIGFVRMLLPRDFGYTLLQSTAASEGTYDAIRERLEGAVLRATEGGRL